MLYRLYTVRKYNLQRSLCRKGALQIILPYFPVNDIVNSKCATTDRANDPPTDGGSN